MASFLKTLFLNPPSYEGFDGGAGSRYQARREIKSFWYPTWLAQPAAMVPGSRLIDAPPDGLTVEQVAPLAKDYELAVLHTSTPSFANDARFAARLKEENPKIEVGMVGAHVGVLPMQSLNGAPAVDWVAVGEFDYACAEIAAGKPLREVQGIAYRENGQSRFTRAAPDDRGYGRAAVCGGRLQARPDHRELLHRLLAASLRLAVHGPRLPLEVHLLPVAADAGRAPLPRAQRRQRGSRDGARQEVFPAGEGVFLRRRHLHRRFAARRGDRAPPGQAGNTWSCNAKANVPRKTLEIMRENGLRLLLVGYESGNQQILNNIKKGIRLDIAREFTKNAKELGITIHGTFILGLPGETPETISETIRFACDIEPETIQVSLAAPYPGTELYRQAQEQGWLQIQSNRRTGGHPRRADAALQLSRTCPRR